MKHYKFTLIFPLTACLCLSSGASYPLGAVFASERETEYASETSETEDAWISILTSANGAQYPQLLNTNESASIASVNVQLKDLVLTRKNEWSCNWYSWDNLFSVILTLTSSKGIIYYTTWNLDLEEDAILDNQTLVNNLGLDSSTAEGHIVTAALKLYEQQWGAQKTKLPDEYDDAYNATKKADANSLTNAPMFIDSKGNLNVICRIYNMSGDPYTDCATCLS